MKNPDLLIKLLKWTGVGFIEGTYKSYWGFKGAKNITEEIMMVNFAVNKEWAGEYPFLIKGLKNNHERKIEGKLCYKKGNSIKPLKKYDGEISIILYPHDGGENDDI